MKMKNKVAVITGGGKNIGRAIALKLAQEGARCAIAARTQAEIVSVVEEIQLLGGSAIPVVCDVRQESELLKLFQKTANEFGKIDVLVNNAGTEFSKPFHQMAREEWEEVFQINTTSVFLSCKNVLPYLATPGSSIVNIASGAGQVAVPLSAAYGASKAAVMQMSKVMALELRAQRVRVNCVCPGFIDSDMARNGMSKLEEIGLPVRAMVEYRQGRLGTAQEVAAAVAFLASEESSFINGQSLLVDGGATGC